MLLLLFGPPCSGKSTVAELLSRRTGASVWTGKDYLRLARSEDEAWQEFMRLAEEAAQNPQFGPGSIIFIATEPPPKSSGFPTGPNTGRVRLIADLEVLQDRFAPRVNGWISPVITTMLEQLSVRARQEEADLEYDTGREESHRIAEALMAWYTRTD